MIWFILIEGIKGGIYIKRIETKNILLREFKTDDAKQAFDNWAGIKKIADLSDFKVH